MNLTFCGRGGHGVAEVERWFGVWACLASYMVSSVTSPGNLVDIWQKKSLKVLKQPAGAEGASLLPGIPPALASLFAEY